MIGRRRRTLEEQLREIEEELAALAAFKAERIDPIQRQLDEIRERRAREDAQLAAERER